MAITSTISSKGQVTVPVEVRRRLGVGAGDQVEFVFDGQQTVLRPVRPQGNPFEKWIGIAPQLGSLEEIIRREREMRGYDEDEF